MDNLGYLFAVFGIVWLVIFIYIIVLINGQRRLLKEINYLKTRLEQKGMTNKDS